LAQEFAKEWHGKDSTLEALHGQVSTVCKTLGLSRT